MAFLISYNLIGLVNGSLSPPLYIILNSTGGEGTSSITTYQELATVTATSSSSRSTGSSHNNPSFGGKQTTNWRGASNS